MQTSGTYPTMSGNRQAVIWLLLVSLLLSGCVAHVYNPGVADNPFHQLQLGQSYGDMVRVLGAPDHGRTEDRAGQEAGILFVPLWNLVETVGDFNPSAIQVYTYDKWGTISIDNNNRIIRIESR
jgi:hypothetical protein